MVFQTFNLFAHKTILQNITLGPLKVRKMSKAQAEAQAMELLEPGRASQSKARQDTPRSCPAASSSGPRSPGPWPCSPRLMLFDEPTSALDPEMVNEVLDVMTAWPRTA